MIKIEKRFLFVVFFCLSVTLASDFKQPTVLISILARNKAHTLPYFLTLLENINYPKDRIALWIRSDHNIDHTIEILQIWVNSVQSQYHLVDFQYDKGEQFFPDEVGVGHWSETRFYHIINLRQTALNVARKIWADYIWSVDCDTFLTDPDILYHLISKEQTIVAPMLRSINQYSNYWCSMNEQYYYERTDDYKPILERKNVGCFQVALVHSCVLIDLRKTESDQLTYEPDDIDSYDGPRDDMIVFAVSAAVNDIAMHICNDYHYGFIMVPLQDEGQLSADFEQLTNIKMEVMTETDPLPVTDLLKPFLPPLPKKDTLGFDKIYVINLLRRPERRKRMLHSTDELGLVVEIVDAVDGKALNESELEGIKFLPGYADPYHKRPMTLGEIGCFLSHYKIWRKAYENGYRKVLVLEDDIRFEPYFRTQVKRLMNDVEQIPDWDLVYLGRKRMVEDEEFRITDTLVKAAYSYWTLGYAVSDRGIRKLLEADPLSKLLPVDEYLPIMFDRHPQDCWKGHFPKRDLVALSAAPLLVYPMRYTGDEGYISDTEDSKVVPVVENSLRTDL